MDENPMDVRRRMAADRQRPHYHFLPPANWMNDPNGVIHWQGNYHLFFQYNPGEPRSHRIHWGHTVSPDMVHWRDLPIALAPTPGATDDSGCWSGSAVDNDGTATLIYTGRSGEHESVCLATGDTSLLAFTKHPANPVIAGPPPELDTTGWRDPYVWREGDEWRMAIGSGVRDDGGMVMLYRSPDLLNWEYLGPLVRAFEANHGTMWECPSFFPLDDRWVLIYSPVPTGKVRYFVGDYQNNRFTPQSEGQVDWGSDFYAPQVMTDADGRRIMFGWSWEARNGTAEKAAQWSPQPEAGWAGVQTLPRVLSLSNAGELLFDPIPETESLRTREHRIDGLEIAAGSEAVLPVAGDRLELALTFAPGCGPLALNLRCAPDGSEQTLLAYDPAAHSLTIDRANASTATETLRDAKTAPLTLEADEPLSLRIFLDRSIIEIYANRRRCMTTRVYPAREESIGLRLSAGPYPVQLAQFVAWEMAAIWPTD